MGIANLWTSVSTLPSIIFSVARPLKPSQGRTPDLADRGMDRVT